MQFTNLLLTSSNKKEERKEVEEEERFEGCEKRLILLFNGTGNLTTIPKLKWIEILKHARCEILNSTSNKDCIAHLLSESSLFIFNKKLMIKTCGTTTLLMILPIIIIECKQINLMISNVFYSRSNFMYPNNQPIIHRTFNNEIEYLNKYFNGYGIILGSLNNARWHCYTNNKYDKKDGKVSLEIVLFDLDNECMKYYFQENNYSKMELDKRIVNGCCIPVNTMIDTHLFKPCGYSLNGILDDNYWTIHITPEKEGSFVSFETDYKYDSYKFVIQKVVEVFKPKRFSFAINCYNNALSEVLENGDWKLDGFDISDHAVHRFSKYHNITWFNYNKCREQVERGDGREEMMNILNVKGNSLWKYIQNNIVYDNNKYSKSTSQLLYGRDQEDNNYDDKGFACINSLYDNKHQVNISD